MRDEWVRVSVRDQGEGIPEEFRARIFNKFAHADSTSGRFKGGAGLGLYIARQLVEQMRGRIGFTSHGDQGHHLLGGISPCVPDRKPPDGLTRVAGRYAAPHTPSSLTDRVASTRFNSHI